MSWQITGDNGAFLIVDGNRLVGSIARQPDDLFIVEVLWSPADIRSNPVPLDYAFAYVDGVEATLRATEQLRGHFQNDRNR